MSLDSSPSAGSLSEPLRSAALAYAVGDAATAAAMLDASLETGPDPRRAWLMLLDLERLRRRWRVYETLAARYRVRFGEEAPAERLRRQREVALPEELRQGGSGCVPLSGPLDGHALGAVADLRTAASRHTVVHLDASRVEGVDVTGCRLLLSALRDLIDAGNGILLTGAEDLGALLRAHCDRYPGQQPAWDLLLLARRLDQDPDAFDRDAAAFALATGTAAPAWEPLFLPQRRLSDVAERRGIPRYDGGDIHVLAGVVEDPADPRLAAVAAFAAGGDFVNLDLSRLERLTPLAAETLVRLVIEAAAAARMVRLLHPNHVVGALLESLGAGGSAALVLPR